MLKITIDTFRETDFFDIYITKDNKTVDFDQGIKLTDYNNTIDYYMIIHGIKETDFLTQNVYEDDYLLTAITDTIQNFKQGTPY